MPSLDQAASQLANSKKILLTARSQSTIDEMGSLIALALLFTEQGKKVKVVFPSQPRGFLKELLKRYKVPFTTKLDPLNYVISLPYQQGNIDKVSYDTDDKNVNLYITPGTSEFDFDNVRYAVSGSNFDSILVVGARSLKWLGDVYLKNTKVFKRAKTINLNNRKGSQEFGDFLLTDFKKTTVAETVYEMISLLGGTQNQQIIDVLTEAAVAGLDVLQTGSTSIDTMEVLNNLTKAGGNIKQAVNSVYFSIPHADFKVMRSLTDVVKTDENSGIVWSAMSLGSIKDMGGDPEDLFFQVKIPFNLSSKYKVAFALFEVSNGKVQGIVESKSKKVSAYDISRVFRGRGNSGRAEFVAMDKSVVEVEQDILARIWEMQGGKKSNSQSEVSPDLAKGGKSKAVKIKKSEVQSGVASVPEAEAKEGGPEKAPKSSFVSPPEPQKSDFVPFGAPLGENKESPKVTKDDSSEQQ